MSNIQDTLLEHGLKKLQTTDNQEPKNSGCADLFHDIPVPWLLNRFYATCSGNEEKKRRIKINQGLIGRIPISTNTAFRIMQCCIIHQWNSPSRFHALSLTCWNSISKSRNSDRCRSSLRLCPKVASKIEVDVVVVFVSSVLREASAHFTWQQWSPGCPTKGAQICGHHFLAQQMWQEEMLPPICIYVTYYKLSKHYLQIPTVSKILEEPLKHGITHLNFSIKSSLYAMLHVVVFCWEALQAIGRMDKDHHLSPWARGPGCR